MSRGDTPRTISGDIPGTISGDISTTISGDKHRTDSGDIKKTYSDNMESDPDEIDTTPRIPKGTICGNKKKHQYDWYDLEVESDTTYGDPNTLTYT